MKEYRVIGPPGTGKTTYLADKIERAARDYGSDGVIVSSFTRAAAHEIASRGLPVNRSRIGTLHALCYRALGAPVIAEAKVGAYNAWLQEERPEGAWASLGATSAVTVDDPLGLDFKEPTGGDRCLQALNRCRNLDAPRELWPEDVQAFAALWTEWKEETGYCDFTDLIVRAIDELPYAPGTPAIGFFDEVQDWGPLEFRLVRQWGKHMRGVMLAGDPDQSIYGFKGATPDAFFTPEMPDEDYRVLDQSHRIPSAVHDVAHRWIRECHARKRDPVYRPRAEKGEVAHVNGSFRDVEPLVDHALSLHGDSMFLATCGYMLHPLLALLKRQGIPFHNPFRKTNGGWNPMRSCKRLVSFLRPVPELLGRTEERRLWTWKELWDWVEFLRATAGLLRRGAKQTIKENASGEAGGESTIHTDLQPLFTEEGWFKLKSAFLTNKPWSVFEGVIDAKLSSKMAYAISIAEARGPQGLLETPRVIVGTIHSVKGGEADNVYLFPDLSMSAARQWWEYGEPHDSVRRAFYVGMTRAKRGLYLPRAATRTAVEIR